MKARILRTNYYTPKLSEGEIVEIIKGMETDAEGVWNAPAGKLVLCRKQDNTFTYASPLDMEIIEYNTIDWAAFRREAAKDFMSAIITREAPQYNFACRNVADRVTEAIMWADELIKQLKEEKA